ncbi:MAG: AAA family ATPase [Sphingobium sp.]
MAMLIIFGGLPGTGKTGIGKALAVRGPRAYVRIDEIEHALSRLGGNDIGVAGYVAGHAVASSNLKLGIDVVADSVNPVPESREGWRRVARETGSAFAEVEIVCSDEQEHRRRVEGRVADIAGFTLPSWSAVQGRVYAPWTGAGLRIDTAELDVAAAVARIEAYLDSLSVRSGSMPGGPA